MGKSGETVTIGYRYSMSMHMGLCRGPLDEIVQIDVGETRAFPIPDGDSEVTSGLALIAEGPDGVGIALNEDGTSSEVGSGEINTIRTTGAYAISAPNLFGGDKKEGGVSGSLTVYMGAASQTVASWIKSLMGGTVPDFRGVSTMFFDGLLCSLNPYPKPWRVRVRRTSSGWDGDVWQPELATIWLASGTLKAMNPAHILYECITNRDWGRGFPREIINDTQWAGVAQTLHDEGLGLCLRWNRQDRLSAFTQEVIDHIGGALYPDRATGLLSLQLFRGGYDVEELPTFDYNSGLVSIDDAETASQEDSANEVVVNWKDPIRNEERQSRVQNLGSIQSLGAPNSVKNTYYGLPTSDLALRAAQRDIKAASGSLKRYSVVLDRSAWELFPGSVFRVSAPDKNIFSVVLRAGKVSDGKIDDGRITVEAVLDVFGLPNSSFIGSQDSAWQPPVRTPSVISRRLVRESTYADLFLRLRPADLELVPETSGAISIMAGKPTPLTQNFDIATKAAGEDYAAREAGSFCPTGLLAGDIDEYDEDITINSGASLEEVVVGTAVQIGSEICRVDAISTGDGVNAVLELARGCVDTIPEPHSEDDLVFFYGSALSTDGREYTDGESVDVKLLSNTSTQQLNIGLASEDSVSITARQAKPWPPGNVRVNGDPFAEAEAVPGDAVLTWAHRDRITSQDQLVAHGASSVGPEAGTTYTIRMFLDESAPTPVRTVTGVSGTTHTYTLAQMAADAVGSGMVIEIESVLDSEASTFKYRFPLTRASLGYGASYGSFYGS